MNIIQEPDQRLNKISTRIADFDEAKKIVDKLTSVTKTVDKPWKLWLGMAAPQIGYNQRIIILRRSYGKYEVMVNPEVLKKKWLFLSTENCYSLKGKGRYLLKRYFWLKIKYQDLNGHSHQEVSIGPRAYTMQQELDHINGVLISDIGWKIY